MEWVYIAVMIILVCIVANISLFNHFIQLRLKIVEAESNIKIVLQRRADLIGVMAGVAKSYTHYENKLFLSITQLRKELFTHKEKTYEEIEQTINHKYENLIAVSEENPTIKSDEIFIEVQEELIHNENLILGARRYFNTLVLKWNINTQQFPFNITAKIFKFKPTQFYSHKDEKETGVNF